MLIFFIQTYIFLAKDSHLSSIYLPEIGFYYKVPARKLSV